MIKRSESITELCKALIQVSNEVGKIEKTATNPFFKSKYAPLPEIQEALREPLSKAGLCYTQHAVEGYKLVTLVMHNSGEWMESTYDICPIPDYIKDTDIQYIKPQSLGSAITYAKRYALVSIFALSVDEDDDGNEGSKLPQNKKKAPESNGKPWLNENTKQWDNAMLGLNNGRTIEEIENHYKLSKKVRKKLEEALQRMQEVKNATRVTA